MTRFGQRQLHFLIHILMLKHRSWSSLPEQIPKMTLPHGSPIFKTDRAEWFTCLDWLRERSAILGLADHQQWCQQSDLVNLVMDVIDWCEHYRVQIITRVDKEFPDFWRHLSDPPHAFFVSGNANLFLGSHIAVVGARKATSTAMKVGFEIGRYLAACEAIVVSGGAVGCDTAAHLGAMHGSGNDARTIVVQAGGLAHPYPAANYSMFRRIVEQGGAIMSERLPMEKAMPWDFLSRNRLIAGLGMEAVVLQAAKKSGAMVTARHAVEQGKDVYILKHDPTDVRAAGSWALIADGATAFTTSDEYIFGKLTS